jgi:phosphatidylglycerophosphate synthase
MYMRAISLRWTRHLVATRVTPNQLTYLMVLAGLAAGAALLVPGLAGALAAALLIQLYLLLDCVDGEVARWRGETSVTGVYLDRVGHYLAEAALLAGLGLRAADVLAREGPAPNWLWAFLGAIAALGAILIKAETDLVDVARSRAGLPAAPDASAAPRSASLALARRAAAALRFHRLVGGVEASLLIVLAAVLDSLDGGVGGLFFTRLAVAALTAIALLQAVLHLVSVLASSRLR